MARSPWVLETLAGTQLQNNPVAADETSALLTRCFPGEGWVANTAVGVLEMSAGFHDLENTLWLLLRDGASPNLVGVATCVPYHNGLYVCNLAVDPARRRCGAGLALLEHAALERSVRDLPEPRLLGSTVKSDPTILRFYQKLGAEVVETGLGSAGAGAPSALRLRSAPLPRTEAAVRELFAALRAQRQRARRGWRWALGAATATLGLLALATAARELALALGLALASSTDNFAVGFSMGLVGRPLRQRLLLIVSASNAAGALLAAQGGVLVAGVAPLAAPLLATGAFAYLGGAELQSWWRGEAASPLVSLASSDGSALQLALPMTINNLAGGVAGGVAGVGPALSAACVLAASFGMMPVGHELGRRVGNKLPMDPRLAAGTTFLVVSLNCLVVGLVQ